VSTYPRGKLRHDDEGQLRIAMAVKDNTLIIDFGKSVRWFGLGLHEVTALRELLQKHEQELKGKSA